MSDKALLILAFIFFSAILISGYIDKQGVNTDTIVRNCSLTGTYVIDNDTVLACRVIKRNTDGAKPSEPKEEEQSL
jgi:hypothetical protein